MPHCLPPPSNWGSASFPGVACTGQNSSGFRRKATTVSKVILFLPQISETSFDLHTPLMPLVATLHRPRNAAKLSEKCLFSSLFLHLSLPVYKDFFSLLACQSPNNSIEIWAKDTSMFSACPLSTQMHTSNFQGKWILLVYFP